MTLKSTCFSCIYAHYKWLHSISLQGKYINVPCILLSISVCFMSRKIWWLPVLQYYDGAKLPTWKVCHHEPLLVAYRQCYTSALVWLWLVTTDVLICITWMCHVLCTKQLPIGMLNVCCNQCYNVICWYFSSNHKVIPSIVAWFIRIGVLNNNNWNEHTPKMK